MSNERRTKWFLIGWVFLSSLVPSVVLAQATTATPPSRMTYQGYVTDGSGTPIGQDGARTLNAIFRIYDAATGGVAVWAEQQAVAVDRGYLSVQLGEGTPVAGVTNPAGGLSFAFTGAGASERYVGVTLVGFGPGGTDIEVSPRVRLTSAPYAYLATAAAGLASSSGASLVATSTNLSFAGTVTAPSISTPTLSVGNLTVTNGLNFSGLAGGFVSSTDMPFRVLGGVHRWTNINNILTFVTEPSKGYSVTRTQAGTYRVVFDTPFSSPPMVIATLLDSTTSAVQNWCDVIQSTTTSNAVSEVTIRTWGQPWSNRNWVVWTTMLNSPTSWQGVGQGAGYGQWVQWVGTQQSWMYATANLALYDQDFSFVVIGN